MKSSAGMMQAAFVYRSGREGRQIEDEVLVDRILAGEREAFRVLAERYARTVYQAVYGVLRNAKDTEDVVQEAFVQIYVSLPKYERRGLKSWMTRIAVHKAIDWRRKMARRKEEEWTDDAVPAPDHARGAPPLPEQLVLDRERKRKLAEKLGKMPGNYREVIVAYYLEEKSYQQIAAEFSLEPKSVESRLYRARKWLRKHWKEDDFW